MIISLLDMEVVGVKSFKNRKMYIDLKTDKRVSADEKEEYVVSQLSGSNYKNNVIALAGINASGKTTVLKFIKFILLVFIQGKSLNDDENIFSLLDSEVRLKLHFYKKNEGIEDELFEVNAILQKEMNRLIFVEEEIITKSIQLHETKKKFLDFTYYPIEKRSQLSNEILKYLKEDESFFSIISSDEVIRNQYYIRDLLSTTNENSLSSWDARDYMVDALRYFDDRIEQLTLLDRRKGDVPARFKLKFIDEPEPKEISLTSLANYLSSGTIKGLNLLINASLVLENGGYLLIDELELHFNKIIVENIIHFFQSEVNKNGATLIFSTHYSELLDNIRRKEVIKVLRKEKGELMIESLTNLAKKKGKDRTDIKSSDLILSGIFGTAPDYSKYNQLKKSLIREIYGSESSE